MILTKFCTYNYFSFKERVSIDLHDFTIFIGANGSGKTAMLSCLELFLGNSTKIESDKINEPNKILRNLDAVLPLPATA